MTRPLVLVIEDDDTLQQFFGMVLEMMPVEHRLCSSAEEALQVLQTGAADVIVTDLFLPGRDGRDLLRHLSADPGRRPMTRVIVMSGSIDDEVRRELTALGAWKVLGKPVTVKVFKEAITEALSAAGAPDPGTMDLDEQERHALQEVFGGQEALFRAYRERAFALLPQDIERGEMALSGPDHSALRHLAHNLKGVLRTLGRESLSAQARQLEDAAARIAPQQDLAQHWAPLRDGLRQIIRRST